MRSPARVAAPLAALLLAGCAGASGGATAGTTATSTAASTMTPETASTTASPTAAPTARPVAAEGLQACRAQDVRLVPEPDGATGETLLVVRVLARPDVRCRLDGYPRVRAVTDGPAVPVAREPFVPGGAVAGPFAVAPGSPGVFVLGWRMAQWCAPPVRLERFEVTLPGGGTVDVQGFGRAACDRAATPDEHTRQPVSVSRFLPER